MDNQIAFAVIGGSGLYSMPGLVDIEQIEIDTPFGRPSSPIVIGRLEGKKIAFLARHGLGHFISPTEVNYRANIFALKSLGVQRVVSISACGSLREDYEPGQMVVPDQLLDFTHLRPRTFFGEGLVAHISSADPFCNDWSKQLWQSASSSGAKVHYGGTFITIEGPRFSTKAESKLFRSWGLSIIGMTASPEAFLAREAEICYATLAHVTDYDVWHVSVEPVTVEMVIKTLNQNTNKAQEAIMLLAKNLDEKRTCNCKDALSNALITSPDAINPATKVKLRPLIEKYIH